MSVICSNENLTRKENKMEAKKKALSNGWIDNVDHSYKYWSNQIDLRHIRELIRQKEWEKNNRLYLRRIKANSRGTVRG